MILGFQLSGTLNLRQSWQCNWLVDHKWDQMSWDQVDHQQVLSKNTWSLHKLDDNWAKNLENVNLTQTSISILHHLLFTNENTVSLNHTNHSLWKWQTRCIFICSKDKSWTADQSNRQLPITNKKIVLLTSVQSQERKFLHQQADRQFQQ